MRFRGAFLTVAAILALAGTAGAIAGQGDPPTFDFQRCDKSLRPCSDPLVLASGPSFAGDVEIIGFSSKPGFCFESDRLQRNVTYGVSVCGTRSQPRGGKPIGITIFGGGRAGDGRYSEVSGTTRADVAGVRARVRRHGETKQLTPVFATVDEELASRVGESRPFGVFQLTARGCLRAERIKVTAYDSAGGALGTTRFPSVGNPCGHDGVGAAQTRMPGRAVTTFRRHS